VPQVRCSVASEGCLRAPSRPAALGRVAREGWRAAAGPEPDEAAETDWFVPLAAIAESGAPAFRWALRRRDQVWADDLSRLVGGATGARWDASRDVPWGEAAGLPDLEVFTRRSCALFR
jgi:hypothetical protein